MKLADGERPTRPSSKDSLKQKMPKMAEEAPRPSKSEEVRWSGDRMEQRNFADYDHFSNSKL
jgi:hypothetical protein